MKEKLLEFINSNIVTDLIYLVDLKVKETASKVEINVLLDTDAGIDIDTCSQASRKIDHFLEENQLIDKNSELEVSSPGLDYPLSSLRQYNKNIGRKLSIELTDGKKIAGKLLSVSESGINLMKEVESKIKGKKLPSVETQVAFADIKLAKVVPIFS